MRRSLNRFHALGARLVAVSPAAGETTSAVCEMLGQPHECLGDPSGAAYDAFGLGRMRPSEALKPSLILKTIRAFFGGFRQSRPQGDPYRLPGAFIIDREGVIRWAWRASDAADHPSDEDLLSALNDLKLS